MNRERLHEIIFEADTPLGRLFDLALLIMILASVVVVMLESMDVLHEKYGSTFYTLEWIFTIFFTIEYFLRIYCVRRPRNYILSFYGIIDLLAILPTYLSLIIPGAQYFLVIRALRLLRVFRIFKLVHFTSEGAILFQAISDSKEKIGVFLFFILNAVVIIGALMYFIEGGYNSGFSSIPTSIYWAIVTLTTVGFGDITPITYMGKIIAAMVMIMGYSVIAVPTGIVTSEMVMSKNRKKKKVNTQVCHQCGRAGHDNNAKYCKYCGFRLHLPDKS